VTVTSGDALSLYGLWPAPVVIVADGPYGLGGPGDLRRVTDLPDWYDPHAAAWAAAATPLTTLWFWNKEVGWATAHPVLARHGWVYRQCCVWDKGLTHAANHTNTRTLRKLPTVTEVCVQYVRPPEFRRRGGTGGTLQTWLRDEWTRAGLSFRAANRACGCGDMARRRWLIGDRHWSRPPPAAFARLAAYANRCGDAGGRPYFSLDGVRTLTAAGWARASAGADGDWERRCGKFFCEPGLTNVWRVNPVRGAARVRDAGGTAHPHQKPVELMERVLRLSSEPGDVVWEPFGGLFTVALAAARLGRAGRSAEVRAAAYRAGVRRLEAAFGAASAEAVRQ
jgi:hypothetical protein